MKRMWILLAAAVVAGCGTFRSGLVLDPVGPAPGEPEPGGSTNGVLVVYSAYDGSANSDQRDAYRPVHSDYRILTANGAGPRVVHNDSGTILQEPARVSLPEGRYQVVARANGYGTVTVPVVIEGRRTTVVHLAGGSWPNMAAVSRTNVVRSPDGGIVGWRAASP